MPSANGYKLEVDGHTLVASWAATAYALIIDDTDGEDRCPPLLIHCETVEDARRKARVDGGFVLDAEFNKIQ